MERLEGYRHDDLLLAALKDAVAEVEGFGWEVLVSASRVRPLVDARRRAEAVYAALAEDSRGDALAEVFKHHRTTYIFGREQHETLMFADRDYAGRYHALLKCVVRNLQFINNTLKKQEGMFTGTISGRLGRAAEVKTINEKDYYKFSVAANDKGDKTTWVQVLYRKGASSKLGEYLQPGAGVVVQGRVEARAYKGKDGEAHADMTIWADTLEVLKFPAREEKAGDDLPAADDGDMPF